MKRSEIYREAAEQVDKHGYIGAYAMDCDAFLAFFQTIDWKARSGGPSLDRAMTRSETCLALLFMAAISESEGM
jgi:hypothetical protein